MCVRKLVWTMVLQLRNSETIILTLVTELREVNCVTLSQFRQRTKLKYDVSRDFHSGIQHRE